MKNININSDKSIASDNKIDLEYFKAVFDELPECFQILSQDGYILEVNQLWLDILGYRKKDVIGKHFTRFVFSDDLENAISCINNFQENEDKEALNLRLIKENGDKVIFSFNGKLIYDTINSINRIVCHMKVLTVTDELRNKIKNDESLLYGTSDTSNKILNVMHVLEVRDQIQKLFEKNEKLLYDSAMKFSELSYEDNIFDLIAKELIEIIPNSYIVIVSHSKETDEFKLESYEGFGNLFSKVLEILEVDNSNHIRYKIDRENIRKKLRNKLEKDEEGLSSLTSGAIDPKTAAIITKLLNIENTYYIGFVNNDIVFGAVGIFLKKGNKIDNIETIETITYQASIALQKRETEKLLRESEDNLRNIYDSVNDAIFIHDFEGNIKEVNKKTCEILSYSKEEITNMNIYNLMPKSLIQWVKSQFECLIGDSASIFEISLVSRNYDLIHVEFNSKIIKIKDSVLILSVSRELMYKNRTEIELADSQLKYNIEMGKLYIFGNNNSDTAFNLFNSFINSDYKGFIISRISEKKYIRKIKGSFEFFHITTELYGKKINPNFVELISFIENAPFRSIFILDSFYYLLIENDLKDLFLFTDSLRNIGQFKKHYYFVFLDEEEVGKKIYKIVANECYELEEKEVKKLPKDNKDIMLFIYNQNKSGVAPTLTEIAKYSKLSRPTINKKIKELIHNNLIKQYKKGKSIHFELTKVGLDFFEV